MELGETILKLLSKRYQPSSLMETHCQCYDIAFKTDRQGLPVVAFLGKKDAKGKIRGERFARRLRQLTNGTIIKGFWECTGETVISLP
jgi:hypothetical protein